MAKITVADTVLLAALWDSTLGNLGAKIVPGLDLDTDVGRWPVIGVSSRIRTYTTDESRMRPTKKRRPVLGPGVDVAECCFAFVWREIPFRARKQKMMLVPGFCLPARTRMVQALGATCCSISHLAPPECGCSAPILALLGIALAS